MSNSINPIYVEYSIRDGCDAYKINNPWTLYAKHTIVLCTVQEGILKAESLAKDYINKFLSKALEDGILKIQD